MDKEKCLVCGKLMGNSLSTIAVRQNPIMAFIDFPVHSKCRILIRDDRGYDYGWATRRHKQLNTIETNRPKRQEDNRQ
jgi:hypothetical protein